MEKYIDKFNRLIRISDFYNNQSITLELQNEICRLEKNYFYLAVIGQIKRGKSTLINALIGTDLLPTAVLPLTSIVTMIRYGEKIEVKIIFENNNESLIPKSELKNYITEAGNPDNHKKIKCVEITYPSEFIKEGIVLIDTPGIGSLFLHNTKSTEDFIPKIDAGIFVLSVDPPITKTEFDFFSNVYSAVNSLFFVINKTDLINKENLNEIISYTSKMISGFNHNLKEKIYPLSSLKALEARVINNREKLAESGILNLERELEKLIEHDKIWVLEDNLNRKINMYISQLNFSLELQLNSMQTPVSVFNQKIDEFEREMEEVSKEKILIIYHFTEQIDDLLNKIESEIENFVVNSKGSFYKYLQNFLDSSVNAKKTNLVKSSRVFLSDLLTSKFENWRSGFEQMIYKQFSMVIVDAVVKINALIKKISGLSAGLFNISAPLYFEELNIKLPSEFFYYTEDPALFLEIDFLKISSLLLPKKFLSKLILRKMGKGIEEKLMINSGKVLSFYKSLVTDNSLKFKYSMNDKISHVIFYINNIIVNARKNKESNEVSIEPQIKKIQEDMHSLKNILGK